MIHISMEESFNSPTPVSLRTRGAYRRFFLPSFKIEDLNPKSVNIFEIVGKVNNF